MTDIDIRPARPSDVIGLVASVAGLFAEDAGTRDDTLDQRWPREHGPASLSAGIADEDRLVLVAAAGDEIVGHLTGSLAEPTAIRPIRVATVVGMYVFPGHRDAGVGGRLVAAFREWAAGRRADRVAVSAYAANEPAIRFYRRQGFTPRAVLLETSP